MMIHRHVRHLLAAGIMIFGFYDCARAAGGEFSWGVRGGYVMPSLEFRQQLSPGFTAGIHVLYPLSSISRYAVIEGEMTAARWPLKNSDDSALHAFSINAGPLFLLPSIIPVMPYAGCSLQASYFYLNADRIGEKETALRPGIIAKTGLFAELTPGVGIRAGADYSVIPLSGRVFGAVAMSISATMNYQALKQGSAFSGTYREDRRLESELVFMRGKRELENGNSARAKDLFKQVIKLEHGHEGAASLLAEIDRMEKQYARGSALFDEKRFLEALPELEAASSGIRDAAVKLEQARGILKSNITAWEKTGIEESEKKNYDSCIYYMDRILLVDPGNRTARIYLPRAKNRKDALEKLK